MAAPLSTTTKRTDSGGPLLNFVAQRQNIRTPEIPTRWSRSTRNRDVWTRNRSTVIGYVHDQNDAPVGGAQVFIFPSSQSYDQVQRLFAASSKRAPNVHADGADIVYGVDVTDKDGFFETWIDAKHSFHVRIEKPGYTTLASDNWNPASGLAQNFSKPFVIEFSGYSYQFTNGCEHPVQLAIRYKNMGGTWQNAGWWKFSPNETAYLVSGGQRLRSNNAVWYYYAETTDNSNLQWSGDHSVTFNGRSLLMKELRDAEGESTWTITCN